MESDCGGTYVSFSTRHIKSNFSDVTCLKMTPFTEASQRASVRHSQQKDHQNHFLACQHLVMNKTFQCPLTKLNVPPKLASTLPTGKHSASLFNANVSIQNRKLACIAHSGPVWLSQFASLFHSVQHLNFGDICLVQKKSNHKKIPD